MHSHLVQNDMILFGFYIFPWTNKPHFCFVLFLTLVTHHGKLSLLDRGNIYNFSLLFRENKWGSHSLSNATKLARQIQEIGEIWVGFSQWQLDFGSSCGFTTAAAERKPHIETGKKGLEIYMHRLERALLDFALPLLCFMAFFYANTICKITKPTAPELTDVLCWQFSLIFSGFSMPPCNTFSYCPPRKDQLSNIFYLFTRTSTSRPKVTLNLTSVDHLRSICIYIFLVATFGKHISHGTVWVKGKADSVILGWYLWTFGSIITSSDLKFAVVCC